MNFYVSLNICTYWKFDLSEIIFELICSIHITGDLSTQMIALLMATNLWAGDGGRKNEPLNLFLNIKNSFIIIEKYQKFIELRFSINVLFEQF